MDEGLVVERGLGASTGGRPSIHLRLNESRYRAIGIDLHDWQTRFSVSALDGRIIEARLFRTADDPYKTLASIAEHTEAYRREHTDCEIVGIGVGARGFDDARTGVVERGSDPAWQEIPLGQYLRDRLGVPVYVDNVVRAAGEFGQMVIAETDGRTRHDRSGCLEMLASNKAILRRYRSASGNRRGRSSSHRILPLPRYRPIQHCLGTRPRRDRRRRRDHRSLVAGKAGY